MLVAKRTMHEEQIVYKGFITIYSLQAVLKSET
jgi:hypothetical protein